MPHSSCPDKQNSTKKGCPAVSSGQPLRRHHQQRSVTFKKNPIALATAFAHGALRFHSLRQEHEHITLGLRHGDLADANRRPSASIGQLFRANSLDLHATSLSKGGDGARYVGSLQPMACFTSISLYRVVTCLCLVIFVV